jgi:hypothetical protein
METTHGPGSGHEPGCFGCRIKHVLFSPSAMPTRTRISAPPKEPQNNWERGVARDERGLPLVGEDGPIGVKEFADDKARIKKRLKEVKDPRFWESQTSSAA